jgi:hypothetical protein
MNTFFSQRNIGIIVGLLAVVGVGTYFYQQSMEKKEQEAKSALYKIQKTFQEENAAVPAAERDAGVTVDVDAKFSKTVSELNGMISSKTAPDRILFEAVLKLGTLYLDHNQFEKAAGILKNGSQFAKTHLQKATGQYLLGVSYERANQAKEALASFQAGLAENVDGLKGELLLGMVRMSLKMNDKEKAKLYSEKMNKELQGSKATETAMALVKELK